jgi:hypothetical protein
MRLDGAIPLLRRIFLLEPYLLLGLNLGYNTTAYYGWNHFQFGLKASRQLSRLISIHGGISYSVALTALQQIDQGNEVWAMLVCPLAISLSLRNEPARCSLSALGPADAAVYGRRSEDILPKTKRRIYLVGQ